MDYLALLLRWIHIIPAAIMIGGAIFIRCCLLSSNITDSSAGSLMDQNDGLRKQWMKLVSLSTLLLLVSGTYNGINKILVYKLSPDYHGLFGLKLLLGLFVFYLAAVLAGRSERAKRMRERETYWMNILVASMLAIALIGGYMKVASTDAPLKTSTSGSQQVSLIQGTK